MIGSLPLFHRITGQPVIVLGTGAMAEAKRRLVERAGGIVADEDAPDARLAFVALADEDEARAAAGRLRARNVLVNVVDRPALCDFTVPSILERAPVLIAIGTGGASAGLAKALRLRLEGLLPARLGALADALQSARAALRERWTDPGERRRVLDAALAAGGALDPLDERSAERVGAWLTEAVDAPVGMVEFTCSSVDPDELTLRQARWLGSADLVAYEPGVPSAILDRARADAARLEIPLGAPAPAAPGLVVTIRRG
ncbi:MAG TPA: NAD(P)-dependent oxidoreductase [Novosphingobium sp.]|nr:NAD(P)-dependent oxidoreductase [Novosphingobium sp.]